MITAITKRLEFDAGHRLVGHESKCKNLHGHRYAAEITVELTGDLDDVGRVVDFGVIKQKVGGWIDDELDHAFIVNAADPLLAVITSSGKHFVVDFEPTAENLAQIIFDKAAALLDDGRMSVVAVKLFETPTSSATVAL